MWCLFSAMCSVEEIILAMTDLLIILLLFSLTDSGNQSVEDIAYLNIMALEYDYYIG